MGKAADDLTTFNFFRRLAFFSVCDNLTKVFIAIFISFNVSAAGKASRSGRINAVLIAFLWWYNTVSRKENWSVKGFKFFLLLPPGITIVTHKVIVFFEIRIIMSRQHF